MGLRLEEFEGFGSYGLGRLGVLHRNWCVLGSSGSIDPRAVSGVSRVRAY